MTDETPPRRGLLGALHRYRRVLGVAALAGFGLLMAGGIFLSQLDARLGLNLFGPKTWVAGEPAVIRVALRELRFDRLQDLRRATARLVDAEGVEAGPFELREAAGTMVQGTVWVPHAGAWTLTVEVEVEDAGLSIEVPITALPTAPGVALPAAATASSAVTLAQNLASAEAVDDRLRAFVDAGGRLVKPAAKADWGGYTGYAADLDGHLWEIAHNPFWPLDEEGRVTLPE